MFATVILAILFATFVGFIAFPIKWEEKGDEIKGSTYYNRKYEKIERRTRLAAVVPGVLFLIVALLTCFSIVGAKTVGVPVNFGKPSDETFKPGPHLKAPWTKVVKIDTTQQVDNYNDGKGDTDHGRINVRLANGSDAGIYASVAWEVNGENASDIYGSYRSDEPTELIYERLVSPNFKQAVQVVLSEYDPTAVFKDVAGATLSPDYDEIANAVATAFRGYISARGEFITVLDVKVSLIALDEATQSRINEFQQEIQKTRIAEQSVKTSTEQARANKILAESLAKTEDGAVAYCLSLIDQGKLKPPVGFSCYPGSSSSLILPASK